MSCQGLPSLGTCIYVCVYEWSLQVESYVGIYGKRNIEKYSIYVAFTLNLVYPFHLYIYMYAPIHSFRTLFHEELSTFINLSAVELLHTFQRFSMDIV